jgi:DNA polymerase III epsilon subunit-like protein
MKYLLGIDLETTGLNPNYNEITEIAVILLNEKLNIIDKFHSYINIDYPERGYENVINLKDGRKVDVYHYTHIDVEKLKTFPKLPDVMESFLSFIKDKTKNAQKQDICLFGQNVKFDENFLRIAIKEKTNNIWPFDYHVISLDSIYTIYYYKKYNKLPTSICLKDMCKEFNVVNLRTHSATEDVTTSVAILQCLVNYIKILD